METQKNLKLETSAGGLIVRNVEIDWEILLICDAGGNWTFPKGHSQHGEQLIDTAIREIAEETGIHDLTYRATLRPATYMYTRDGLVKKTVHYFVFTSSSHEPLVLQSEEGITDAKWINIHDADAVLGYPKTNRPLLFEVIQLLDTRI